MNGHAATNGVLDRIATATSVLRTRTEDGRRIVIHGGTPADLSARTESAVQRLEKVASELEALLKT